MPAHKNTATGPLLSVIVPVYRTDRYLEKCVHSILAQTHSNLEVILVDDGSPDDAGRLCDALAAADARVRVIHKDNGGLSSARNAGLDMAAGDWISFVDSDDWIAPDMLAHLLRAATELSADIAYGRIVSTSGRSSVEAPVTPKTSPTLCDKQAFWRSFFRIGTQDCVFYVCNGLYARSIWDKLRFREDIRHGEDVEATFHAALRAHSIADVQNAVYFYFQNSEGITGSRFTPQHFDLLAVWDHVVDACQVQAPYLTEWARLNRYRTDFTLLLRLISADSAEMDALCSPQEAAMLADLRRHRRVLLSAPIPLGRKAVILALTVNYPLTKYCLRAILRLHRGRA